MFVVLFSQEGAVPGAVRAALWPSSGAASTAPNLGGRRRVFAALGVRADSAISASWQVVGPSSDASPASGLPMGRGALFEHCRSALGDAPWLVRDWYDYHGWELLALLTPDEALASRVEQGVRAAAPRAHVTTFETGDDFSALFTSMCFDAYGREGQEAWELAEEDDAPPLVLFDESEIDPGYLEDTAGDEDDYGEDTDFDDEDEWNDNEDRREDLRACLAIPELARSGAVSVRRVEDHGLYTKLWSLADWDLGPAYAAVSGRANPETLLERYEEGRLFGMPPQRARALSAGAEEWVYLLGYGGGPDEYLGWLYVPDVARAARLQTALEADDRLVTLA